MDTAVQNKTIDLTLNSADHGGGDQFQGLLLEGTGDVGVILIHGRSNTHADSPPVAILRKSLNEAGYWTLSIARNDPTPGDEWEHYDEGPDFDPNVFPEAYARIRTAMAELAKHGVKKVILSGHSMGARKISAFLSEEGGKGPLPVAGFIALGIGTNGNGLVSSLNTLGKVSVPVYDIYGGGDANVSKEATERKATYAAGPGSSYHQIVIGTDETPHPLTGAEDELIDVAGKAAQTLAPVS